MSLYTRLYAGFWTHRKTIRLRALIGDAALWVPPRCWSYAAENQPNGDFSDYSDQELATAVGYTGDATSMREALLQAGFLDPDGRIHNWEKYNGYHKRFSDRAKTAAAARWDKERTKERKEKRRKEASIASSMHQASQQKRPRPEDVIPELHIGPEFQTSSRFMETFAEWVRYRTGGKFEDPKLTWLKLFQSHLNRIAEYGVAGAIASIQESIDRKWQGLFPPSGTFVRQPGDEEAENPAPTAVPETVTDFSTNPAALKSAYLKEALK